MKHVALFILPLALAILATPAFAQENTNIKTATVAIVQPQGWNKASENDERRIASFVESRTENRIDILSKLIIREEHAPALFEAFADQIIENGFTVVSNATEKSFVLSDGRLRKGEWSEYSYTTSNIPISIITYTFTAQNMAYIVVAYFSRAEREGGIEKLTELIQNMVDIAPQN